MVDGTRHGYEHLAPTLARFAALERDDPTRRGLRDELMVGYLPLARNIARRFTRRGEPIEDLEQVAAIGLMHALERFDPAHERDFLAYAVPTVMGEVRRHFRDTTWSIRTPRALKERYLALRAATAALSITLGRAPTVTELAEHLGCSREEVAEAVAVDGAYRPRSWERALDEGDGAIDYDVLHDALGATSGLDQAETRALLHALVGALPSRERTILVLRFVHDRTQYEIAEQLGVSQMQVSRLLTRMLRLLRERLTDTADDDTPSRRAG